MSIHNTASVTHSQRYVSPKGVNVYRLVVWLLMLLAMVAVVKGGLVIFSLSVLFTRTAIVGGWHLVQKKLSSRIAAWFCLLGFGALVVLGFGGLISYLIDFFNQPENNVGHLLQVLAGAMDAQVRALPGWALQLLQINPDSWHKGVLILVRSNSDLLQSAGQAVSQSLAHILLGSLIGWLLAFSVLAGHRADANVEAGPLRVELVNIAARWFRVFSALLQTQARIALVNAIIVAALLYGVLPQFGIVIYWEATLVVSAFLLSLLPSVGTVLLAVLLVLVGFTQSYWLALYGLIVGLVLGKLEVLLSSRWQEPTLAVSVVEQFLVLVVVETLLGWSGMLLVPIFYVFIKSELRYSELF